MVGLDLYNLKPPPYASALIFEVYDDETIQLSFRNDTTKEPYPLDICHHGDTACKFDDWVNLTKDLITDEWDKECGVVQPTHNYQANVLVLLTLLLLTCFSIGGYWIWQKCLANRETQNYTELDEDGGAASAFH